MKLNSSEWARCVDSSRAAGASNVLAGTFACGEGGLDFNERLVHAEFVIDPAFDCGVLSQEIGIVHPGKK